MKGYWQQPALAIWALLCVFGIILPCTMGNMQSMDVTDLNAAEFDVKPGGSVHDFEQTWEEVTCKFTYACQGGTNEQWLMKIMRGKRREFKCTVERPGEQPSYLFFQKFSLEVTGHGGHIKEGYAEGEPGRALKAEEYHIDHKHTLAHVEGKFESKLNKAEAYYITAKKEL